MTDLDAVLIAAHRGNIDRYRRLLRTQLTELERDFIERRLAEERSALNALLARKPSVPRRRAESESVGRSVVAANYLARTRDRAAQSR